MKERDPDTIYGPMGAEVPKGFHPGGCAHLGHVTTDKPITPTDHTLREFQEAYSPQVHRTHIHGPRILTLTISTEAGPGLTLSSQLKFDDLTSPTQAQAITNTLEELNWRLSAALNALIDPDAR